MIEEFGYGYIRELMTKYFGVKNTSLIKAEMLDVDGFDPEGIVSDTINTIVNSDL